MVLSDGDIQRLIALGDIVIDPPLDDSCIQPASVDVHLGGTVRVFRPWQSPHYIDLTMPLDGLTEAVEIERQFSLAPGQFVLGSTVELISIPNYLMARLEGKSSLGRIGLLIHSTAGYIDPGFRGRLTLELYNVCSLPIILRVGMKISQISFHQLTKPAKRPYGHPELGSKYQGQMGPTPTRFHQEFLQPSLMSLPRGPVAAAAAPAAGGPESRTKHRPANGSILRQWLERSEFQGSVARFAAALGVPLKTVEDWVYRGARPFPQNRARLYSLTQLPEFKVGPGLFAD